MSKPVAVLNPLGISKLHMNDGFMYKVGFVAKPGHHAWLRVYANSAKQAAELAKAAGYAPNDVSLFVG